MPFPTPTTTLFPYTTLFRSLRLSRGMTYKAAVAGLNLGGGKAVIMGDPRSEKTEPLFRAGRSEEHTSELQSRFDLVCRLLLEKKNTHRTEQVRSAFES